MGFPLHSAHKKSAHLQTAADLDVVCLEKFDKNDHSDFVLLFYMQVKPSDRQNEAIKVKGSHKRLTRPVQAGTRCTHLQG